MIPTFKFCIKKVACSNCKSTLTREARMLQKMINKGLKPKNPQEHGSRILTKKFILDPYDNDNNFRTSAMNKMYMQHITDVMHDAECSRKLADLEIEVTKVKLAKGYNFLQVYFISKNVNTTDKIITETLNEALGELQAKIGELRILPKVPHLKFIRDSFLENSIRLEKVFAVIDCGKNFQPVNEKKVNTQNYPAKEDGFPVMRQNVFGLDVAKIKKKIEASIVRFKVINIESSGNELHPEHEMPEKLMTFNKKDFIKFFKRRRIDEMRRRNMELKEMTKLSDHFEELYQRVRDQDDVNYEEYDDYDDYNGNDDYDDDDESDEDD